MGVAEENIVGEERFGGVRVVAEDWVGGKVKDEGKRRPKGTVNKGDQKP